MYGTEKLTFRTFIPERLVFLRSTQHTTFALQFSTHRNMPLSSIQRAISAVDNAAKNAKVYLQLKLERKKVLGDIHRETVARYNQGNTNEHEDTGLCDRQITKLTPLYSKFLERSMLAEPTRSWEWVDMLPRFFALTRDGHFLGEIICISMDEALLQRDLERLLALQSVSSAAGNNGQIGFLVRGYQMFSPISEARDDFLRQIRGIMRLINRPE